MSKHQKVGVLLLQLKTVLEQHGHWQDEAPADDKLASSEPFAIDTLSCTEWLQWIFIPKMQFLVDHQFPLPTSFSISPYVEEALKGTDGHLEITQVSTDIDALFSSDTQ
ncbi:YqcC family protein [Enterovibrio coralii]|uniref:Pseudouridine synthase n=1 Tax=Enterovibrio coralii TaxID=294935 RepID=A0A135I6K7_9GAMM|nr:YqcC family protein [Enterovibrio coralii]KXF81024.1 pseudouridine synthase [Enterovibrio coralii]